MNINNYSLKEYLWPSDEQLLLLKAALFAGEEAKIAFHIWNDSIDLRAEFAYATFRLLPLVYLNQMKLGNTHSVMGRLKGVYKRCWLENQKKFYSMKATLNSLKAGKVDVLLLKGSSMVLSYYRNFSLRPMSDFDIAVRPEDLNLALNILKNSGWVLYKMPDKYDLAYTHAITLYNSDQLELDLHFHILIEKPTHEIDSFFWSNAIPIDFQGLELLQLSPTDQLLHTIMHGIKRNLETPIRWIPDAMAIVEKKEYEIDWERIINFAESQCLMLRLSLGLNYLINNFNLVLPPLVIKKINNYHPKLFEKIVTWSFLTDLFLRDALGNKKNIFLLMKLFFIVFIRYSDVHNTNNPYRYFVNFFYYIKCIIQAPSRKYIFKEIFLNIKKILLFQK